MQCFCTPWVCGCQLEDVWLFIVFRFLTGAMWKSFTRFWQRLELTWWALAWLITTAISVVYFVPSSVYVNQQEMEINLEGLSLLAAARGLLWKPRRASAASVSATQGWLLGYVIEIYIFYPLFVYMLHDYVHDRWSVFFFCRWLFLWYR